MGIKPKLYIEVADTSFKRECGLQGRKHLGLNSGMLFKFPFSQRLAFWMKNTYVPLDIAFADDEGKILQIEQMVPLSTRAIQSHVPCRYALEVNRGWFRDQGISVGTRLTGEGITCKGRMPYKKAQAAVPPVDAPVQDPTLGGQPQQPQQQPIDPNVTMDMSKKQLLEYADLHGKGATIVYQPDSAPGVTQVKHVLPTDEGYTFENSKNGEKVFVFDDSPTVTGPGWESVGKQTKSFLIDRIVAIEIDP